MSIATLREEGMARQPRAGRRRPGDAVVRQRQRGRSRGRRARDQAERRPVRPAASEDMVVVSIADERVIEGHLRPSSDTPTHAVLYRQFPSIGGVVHTHSAFASAWAQAQRSIPPLGTTHADHFSGAVPVSRPMSPLEIDGAYERETGAVIVETFRELGLDPLEMPAVLVASHGPFTWGRDARSGDQRHRARGVAALAHRTFALAPDVEAISDALLRRHFQRKHGPAPTTGSRPRSRTGEGAPAPRAGRPPATRRARSGPRRWRGAGARDRRRAVRIRSTLVRRGCHRRRCSGPPARPGP